MSAALRCFGVPARCLHRSIVDDLIMRPAHHFSTFYGDRFASGSSQIWCVTGSPPDPVRERDGVIGGSYFTIQPGRSATKSKPY